MKTINLPAAMSLTAALSGPAAKTRSLLLAFLLCLSGSAWAGSLPIDLTMPDLLMLFKGGLVAAENRPDYARSNIPTAPKPGPTPLGTPIPAPPGSRR